MNKPVFGMVLGGSLGLLDGLSAWAYPEARPMMAAIVLPGMILGIIVGYATQRYGSPRGAAVPPISALALALVLASSGAAGAQAPASPNDLSSLSFFLGRWAGIAEGQPGKGSATREYTSELRSNVIQAKHRGVYPAQPANPKGEVHEDLGIYSYDSAAKRVRFRQFHVEGFVIHYVQEPDTKPGTWIFTSEAIENIPKGYRSRETHVMLGPDEFEEVFELADPGKDFAVYSRTRFKRVR